MKALKTIQEDFYTGLKAFFEELNIPFNPIAEEPAKPTDILSGNYNSNNAGHLLMKDVYFLGIVNDAIFEDKETFESGDQFKKAIKKDYDGIVLLGITLKNRENGLLPTRTQLADITRAFNREFKYTPVTIVFQYGDYISFANSERLKYKQEWREGEKAGKVTILRDIKIEGTHSGHLRILQRLEIKRSGTKAVNSYADLYKYWQEVLSVAVLNKSFYEELSNWYFWAIKCVKFPGEPKKEAGEKEADFLERTKAHRAQNVIRLITRLMFSWFIKEKHLINPKLFDESDLKGIVDLGKKNSSSYYKGILQNLFFATLNQEMNKRDFRRDGQNYNVTNLFRYKSLFKDEGKALALFKDIPFLNGGLFECLDKPGENGKVERIDGFSDRDDNVLSVPNELFFGSEHEEDLSEEYGLLGKKFTEAKVKGLITLLNGYVFTVTENTPVEEDVALDPELLGKVFENLLASYNPETKTTARKQTGSFYTPREIVNYMVDESLIAYLKNEMLKAHEGYLEVGKGQGDIFGNNSRKGQLKLENKLDESPWAKKEAELDEQLHQLFSFDDIQPFTDDATKTKLIEALDKCTILDPACGSGAFPMGVLQKMVHVLQKLDPRNERWKERQLDRAKQIEDPDMQQKLIEDIEEAFENNELDYGRKLYLIENCIYGVDIQPIATQISKLRFFISLIVDQKLNARKENLGIRPLPNLETKFVAANTLVGLERPQQMVLRNPKIEKKEHELNEVRHRHFSAKTPKTKNKWRVRDKELREEISVLLKNDGWGDKVANQVADWDPYDQNVYAEFFDREWMFDMASGFDVVLGNPPYRPIQKYDKEQKSIWAKQRFKVYANSGNIYFLFFEKGLEIARKNGVVSFITSNQWMRNASGEPLRKLFLKYSPEILIDFRGTDIFENVAVLSNIMLLTKRKAHKSLKACDVSVIQRNYQGLEKIVSEHSIFLDKLDIESWLIFSKKKHLLRQTVVQKGLKISDWKLDINYGIKTGFNDAFYLTESEKDTLISKDPKNAEIIKPMLRGKDLARYYPKQVEQWLIHTTNGKYKGRDKEREGRVKVEKDYPSIYEHLKAFKVKLVARQDQGEHWTNLRSCDYDEAFEEPKMIFMNMTKDLIFSYDPQGEFLTNQKCFIVTGDHLRYLTAFFNSKFFAYFFKDNFPELLGDVREVSKVYFEKIPVIKPDIDKIKTIESIVDFIIYHKRKQLNSPVSFEMILEGLIAELYFQDHMKEQSIDISSQVKTDLKKFQVKSFDNLEPNEQDSVIKSINSEWSHPDNVIRNRIKEFAVKSPDILKPILKS